MKHVQFQREELEAQITIHILNQREKQTAPTRQPSTVRATTPIYTRCIK